ncbi:competence protein CoiA family protein [Paenibacillus ihuae]|uniref:competence protein CoiA family protein n=1 Tax=Paenibacillus ihuae TaxID=1232431 RepID=UPI0006D55670|nr:competence protein CoiA family protein [Paenibacillus ihuae]
MDVALYEGETLNITAEISRYSDSEKETMIDKYRKAAEKKAMICPFCHEELRLRAGEIRDIHFAHLKGKSCQGAEAYDTYHNQTKRENKKHTVIKEIIYNELKGQELIRPDLKVEYGYKEKAEEKWKHYPDIYLNKNGREFAVSVITNVHEIGDEKIVKTINKRNKYFKEKGLESIWFVEDRELADDYEHRVLHLWEAEYGLAIKTEEDYKWDKLLKELSEEFPGQNIPRLFGYRANGAMNQDVRSLYYVHSIGDEITFSVYRLILDQMQSPFRGFALTEGYRMNISQALIIRDEILLSDKDQEDMNRLEFANQVLFQIEALKAEAALRRQANEVRYGQQTREEYYGSTVQETIAEVAGAYMTVDIDVVEYVSKLKYLSLSPQEAESLFYYLKVHRRELEDYGLTLTEVKKWVRFALGKISEPKIREWLVEIEVL